jgi:tRNA-specific 2-thiouridylase
MLTREILGRTIFPLGELTKPRVRELLRAEGISAWESDESQELCFIPHGDYRGFLREHGITDQPGLVVDSHGRPLGQHKGIINYTVGQRRGLGISRPKPLYVLSVDPESNTVVVGTREETLSPAFTINKINMLTPDLPSTGDRFAVKIRSTSQAASCVIGECRADSMEIVFEKPQPGIAPGQAAVLYSGETVAGGGWIE